MCPAIIPLSLLSWISRLLVLTYSPPPLREVTLEFTNKSRCITDLTLQ